MTDHDKDGQPSGRGEQQAIKTGVGVAFGAGIGAVVVASTGNPIWIALGAGLGAPFGAILGNMSGPPKGHPSRDQ